MKYVIIVVAILTTTLAARAASHGDKKPLFLSTQNAPVLYVPGSVQKVCQVTGETDLEFNMPTASQTETRFGLVRADHGYSFEHNGKETLTRLRHLTTTPMRKMICPELLTTTTP
jgi:hypothetical protein